jgi:hypothetical protein
MARKYPVAKELQPYVYAAVRQGCKLEERTNHLCLVTRSGRRVVVHRGNKVHRNQRQFLRSNLRKVGIDV